MGTAIDHLDPHPWARPGMRADPALHQADDLPAAAARATDRADRSVRPAVHAQDDPQLPGGDGGSAPATGDGIHHPHADPRTDTRDVALVITDVPVHDRCPFEAEEIFRTPHPAMGPCAVRPVQQPGREPRDRMVGTLRPHRAAVSEHGRGLPDTGRLSDRYRAAGGTGPRTRVHAARQRPVPAVLDRCRDPRAGRLSPMNWLGRSKDSEQKRV